MRRALLMGLTASWLHLGCGSGGGGVTGNAGATGDLSITATSPAPDATQIPVTSAITITFDGVLGNESVKEDHFQLFDEGEHPIAGTLAQEGGGRIVVFTPDSPLAPAMDHTFLVTDDVCDTSSRMLLQPVQFTFRTLDLEPPTVAASTVGNGAVGINRSDPFLVTFSEVVKPASVRVSSVTLKNLYGWSVPLDLRVSGTQLRIDPIPDLQGSREYILAVIGGAAGVADRAGNTLAVTWSVRFRTAADTSPPQLLSSWPAGASAGRSPLIVPAFTFDESMDPGSYEPGGVVFFDEFGNQVLFTLSASLDLRTVRLQPSAPLAPSRVHHIAFASGPIALTDVTGNSIASTFVLTFTTGTDSTPPQVVSTFPGSGATNISPNFVARVVFSEPLDPASVTRESVTLDALGVPVYVTPTLSQDGTSLTVTPAVVAPPATAHTLALLGGADGLRDVAGNPIASFTVGWTTTGDARIPQVIITPPNGAVTVPVNCRLVALFDVPIDSATLNDGSFEVVSTTSGPVAGERSVERGGRAMVFRPAGGVLPGGEVLDVRVRSGPAGIRTQTGNWLGSDATARMYVSYQTDTAAPSLDVTLEEISGQRNHGLAVPQSGFTIDVDAYDAGDGTLDMASLDLSLSGPPGAPVPTSDELFLVSTVGMRHAVTVIPARLALQPGAWILNATVKDLSGNRSSGTTFGFVVVAPSNDQLPFERTQVVWVRFDTDREGRGKGDGVADFDQDLLTLGLLAPGDPIGRNAILEKTVIDGMLAEANRLLARNPNGTPKKTGSVALRLTTNMPCHAAHMEIAVGGQDPEAPRKRSYGEESTGVLGRALYDYRNSVPNENNTGTSPGLGVFIGELFLYEGKIFKDLSPHFVTGFGRTFRVLSPAMGGVPAGMGPLDATVLAAGFSYASATPDQRLRFDQVFRAADEIATAMGIILAHEVGHSVGLVAAGPPPSGLHGDSSLHNANAALGDVMSAFVAWDTLVGVEYHFRDLNLAYLRQRVICK